MRASDASEATEACSASAACEERVVLPDEVLDAIVRFSGWRDCGRLWSKVCRRYAAAHFLEELARAQLGPSLVVVPDDTSSINAAIALSTQHGRRGGHRAGVVLVRPGVYRESVRITADVALLALGGRGSVTVHPRGWEPALAWGGFKVGATTALGVTIDAASAGACSEVCGFALVQKNQLQQVAVYCTFGAPIIAYCDIVGTIHVAGREFARPSHRAPPGVCFESSASARAHREPRCLSSATDDSVVLSRTWCRWRPADDCALSHRALALLRRAVCGPRNRAHASVRGA